MVNLLAILLQRVDTISCARLLNLLIIIFLKSFVRSFSKEYLNPFIDSRIGYNNWRNFVLQFGFGNKLNIDLPNEKLGFIPSLEFYDKIYGKERWKFSNIYSLSIGQGELLVTPLQMANLGVILANKALSYSTFS